MTEIWWCRVYDRPELEADCSFKGVPLQGHKACGLVRLVPVDALVLVREDGNWPEWAVRVITNPTGPYISEIAAETILDALAENPMPPITDEQAFNHRG